MPVNYDLNIIKGSTFSARVMAKNADGTAVDLSNYQTRGYVKQKYSDTGVLLDLKPVPTVGYQVSGYIDILVPATGTQVLPVTQAVYDIEMYGPTGSENFVIKLLDGRVNIYPEVTNPGSVVINYGSSTSEESSAGSGTTTTTTTTTTASPATTTTNAPGSGGDASINITAPSNNGQVSYEFSLTVAGSNFDHWHWTDSDSNPQGFNSYSVGQSVQGVGNMVSAGTNTVGIESTDLPGGSNWGPGTLYVIAVDSNHLVLADSNGNPAKASVFTSIL